MEAAAALPNTQSAPSSSSRIPDDTVFYSIYPDFSLSKPPSDVDALISFHLQILDFIQPYVSDYIWQHQQFNLSISPNPPIPHLYGKSKFGDNLDDEWFIVFLLFEISRQFPSLSVRISDSDGEFLLIEAAYSLPRWINPETSSNRVFIRQSALHVVPMARLSNPTISEALQFMIDHGEESRASDAVQSALGRRISEYPERARANIYRANVRVPLPVAQVLKHEPCLIALAVEGFYDRDIDSMKHAARMEKFGGREEEMVRVSVRMSRAMYAQLVQQMFQAPRVYPMPPRGDGPVYVEAELGMKIACGFEMAYQERWLAGVEGKGSGLDAYMDSLERSGYFEGLMPGSKEHRRRMENAMEYYRKSELFSRMSKTLNAPVRRIDEILTSPHSVDDFRGLDLPPSDDDSWLYNGEDELNSAILERQKEMEIYESQRSKNQKSRKQKGTDHSSDMQLDDFDLGNFAKTMQAFVDKVSSYEGAEVPQNRDSKEVELDADRFIKDMESALGHMDREDTAQGADSEEGDSSSSDLDFDESEDGSDVGDPLDEDMGNTFMNSYSDALKEELKATTLKKSFIRANEQPAVNDKEGTSNASKEDMDEDFTPVDVDVNLVKSLLDSFSSQQGLPGPASNLLGLMGLQLPQDASKGK
ncbi:protein ecdysoneless homolog [Magnolia sinica]|uniref:protein ecdysoneless homolog n=1 Tax=Magnolia sinica TaxID=86752 RepID=UPI00265AAA42|nr:protein ecdysoneless homolog [Magnolia sinica]